MNIKNKQIQVVKGFISQHKNDNCHDWFLACPSSIGETEKYLEIYAKLEGGMFGGVTDNSEFDDDGEIIKEPTEFSIEIRGLESWTGNPIIYEWSLEVNEQ